MKSFLYALCPILLLSACDNEVGGVVSYEHSATLQCPQPQPVPADVAAEFAQYPKNTVMANFYNHYNMQQRQLATFRIAPESETNHCPSSFWAPDNIALEIQKYPAASPMRQFFNNYVVQQRAIDAYYTPGK